MSQSVFRSWSEDDQDEIIGFLREEARTCSTCGTHPDQWEEDRFAFVADTEHCPGDELLAQERRNLPEGAEGMKVFLVTREEFDRRRAEKAETE